MMPCLKTTLCLMGSTGHLLWLWPCLPPSCSHHQPRNHYTLLCTCWLCCSQPMQWNHCAPVLSIHVLINFSCWEPHSPPSEDLPLLLSLPFSPPLLSHLCTARPGITLFPHSLFVVQLSHYTKCVGALSIFHGSTFLARYIMVLVGITSSFLHILCPLILGAGLLFFAQ